MVTGLWTPRVTRDLLLSKCRYFVDTQLWPLELKLDPEGWLDNFREEEEVYAVHLLNSFFYFSRPLVERLFVAAITNLSHRVITSKKAFVRARSEWNTFISQAYFVRVTGEMPNDADSGYLFSRMARQELGISETRIVNHEDILAKLLLDPGLPVIFIDDFVGSGAQFIKMWNREYSLSNGRFTCFETLAKSIRSPAFYYCPLICTAHGHRNIASRCSGVRVYPSHLIDHRYSALSEDSILWPLELKEGGRAFILDASRRAGIPDNGGNVGDWRGFHELGLTIAFEHGPPDATLPLFYWEKNNWKPLMRRT